MDADRFNMLAARVRGQLTRRVGLGALAAVTASAILASAPAAGKHKKRRKRKKDRRPACPTPLVSVCAGKNWCVDRSQTCGPSDGDGKCLVEATGGNLCAVIVYQATTCADCAVLDCLNCRCALAAGGSDRCNNGANGADFICVRPV